MGDILPTARELELLKILWQRGRATVREIYQALHSQETELAYTTVLTVLQTMERKGLVGHESAGKAYVYFARVRREPTFSKLAGSFLERVFDGAMDQYLVRAIESRRPSVEELEQLEKRIAEAKKAARGRAKTRGK